MVKITEESLRGQAGDRVFGQALAVAGKVAGLSADGPLIEAVVDGIPVRVRIGPDGIDARCGCPAPGPCPHAVAVALAWVRTGEDEQVTDLFEALRVLDRDWLARQLAELAAGDPVLSARLLEAAAAAAAAGADAAGAAAAVADLRAELAEELGGLAEEARDHEHYDEWYPDSGDLEELLDEAEVLLDEAPDAVRELADFVIEGIERVLDFGTCYGADLTETLARALDLHLDACLAGSPDPARLAERLFRGALESGWGSFGDALPGYAEVLGVPGMARYEELLAHATGPADELRAMRESLARVRGGTDAVVDMLARQAGKPEDFARIAEILVAQGRDDDAVEWITKGLAAFPGDPRLPALALDGHRKAGRRDQALAMLWRLFTLRPGIWTYQELKREAAADSARWAGRAVAHLRAIRPPLPAVLAEVLLAEGDVAAAWDLVSQDQDGAAIPVNLRMRVVAERAATHPGDVIPAYQDLAAVHVRRGSKPGYLETITYLKMAQGLAERAGAGEDFRAFMTELRAAHPGKKVLHQQLSEAGLP